MNIRDCRWILMLGGIGVVGLIDGCKSLSRAETSATRANLSGSFNKQYQFDSFPSDDFVMDSCNDGAHVFAKQSVFTLKLDRSCGPRIRTKRFFSSGKVSATLRSPAVDAYGVVAAFYLSSGEPQNGDHHQTEIDFELLGKSPSQYQTNYWVDGQYRGTKMHDIGALGGSASIGDEHRYMIDWNSERIRWFVDGKQVREEYADPKQPFKAQMIYLSLWDGKDTNGWGGAVDWSRNQQYEYSIAELKIEEATEASDPG